MSDNEVCVECGATAAKCRRLDPVEGPRCPECSHYDTRPATSPAAVSEETVQRILTDEDVAASAAKLQASEAAVETKWCSRCSYWGAHAPDCPVPELARLREQLATAERYCASCHVDETVHDAKVAELNAEPATAERERDMFRTGCERWREDYIDMRRNAAGWQEKNDAARAALAESERENGEMKRMLAEPRACDVAYAEGARRQRRRTADHYEDLMMSVGDMLSPDALETYRDIIADLRSSDPDRCPCAEREPATGEGGET